MDAMNPAERLVKLQETARRMSREADKAEGVCQQLKDQIKKEFGCKSSKEAETLLVKMREELTEQEETFQTKLEKFEKEFSNALESDE